MLFLFYVIVIRLKDSWIKISSLPISTPSVCFHSIDGANFSLFLFTVEWTSCFLIWCSLFMQSEAWMAIGNIIIIRTSVSIKCWLQHVLLCMRPCYWSCFLRVRVSGSYNMHIKLLSDDAFARNVSVPWHFLLRCLYGGYYK